MKQQHVHQHSLKIKGAAPTVTTSVSSIIFSLIASSHHWLHMGILLILGSSTDMMSTMVGVLWLRRVMVIATLITTVFSLYRLNRHKHMPIWMKVITVLSVVISMGFIFYTLIKSGW